MRSKASKLDTFIDWQAASVTYGLGAKLGGLPSPEASPAGRLDSVTEVDEIASTIWVPLVVRLLEDYPEALSVHIQKKWRYLDGGRQEWGSGNATVGGTNGHIISEYDWPIKAKRWDWDALSESADLVEFRITRTGLDAFTLNGVCAVAPLAEIITQQLWPKLDAQSAFDHVYSAYSPARVASGMAPRRWGVPGLQQLDAYLAKGGNPNAMDSAGLTPLAAAIYLEQDAMVRQLVAAGADMQAPVGGLFAMDIAVLSGNAGMVRTCGELGAAVVTNGFVQPIFRAVDMNRPELLHSLVDIGADTAVHTADGIALADYIAQEKPDLLEHFRSIQAARSVASAIDASVSNHSPAKCRTSFAL